MKEVHYTNSFEEAHAVQARLESQGIAATVESGQSASLTGGALLVPQPFSSFSVYVVREEDRERAREIVEGLLEERDEDDGVEEERSGWTCEECGEEIELE